MFCIIHQMSPLSLPAGLLASAATVFAAPGAVTGYAAAVVAALMLVLWLISIVITDVSIVDPAWGPAFVLVALTAAVTGEGCAGRRWLLCALTAVWGLRLGWHLVRRKLGDREEDRRYAAMRERRGSTFVPWSLVAIFGLQGLLVLIVSLPIQVAADRGGSLSAAIAPGIVVFSIGLFFETVGDEQLRRFKADPANQGQVMDRGLWRYTRHPNYFGDFCVWWGLWLIALTAGGTSWTLIGPVVMSVLLIRVSGAALLERDMAKRRPQYAEYIKRTSGFFPRPPRKGGGA
jgi:steroid 5-alpha reductase family enzyme